MCFDVTFPNMLNSGPDVHDINIESQLMSGSYQSDASKSTSSSRFGPSGAALHQFLS